MLEKIHRGKKYYRILSSMKSDDLVLGGKPLLIGDTIETLWLDRLEPYEEVDTVCFGSIGNGGRIGHYLNNYHEEFEYESIFSPYLWARFPD